MTKRILRAASWVILHVALLLIFRDQLDPSVSLIAENNLPFTVILTFLAAAGLIGGLVLYRADPILRDLPGWLKMLRRHVLVYAAVLAAGTALLLAIWLTPIEFYATSLQREILRAYVSLLILGGTYLILFWRGRDSCLPFWAWVAVGAAVASAAILVTVHFLDRFPQLNTIDELHNWVVQWTFANTGLLGDSLYKQMIPLPQPIYDSPHYALGFLLRFIGDSFWQARFARLLMACLALPFIYLCGKRMYGARTGLFAVVFAVIIMAPTAYVRPDVFVGVMLSVALYVYWRAQTTRRPWMHYLTGLCVALAGEGHPLAYRFGLAFALIYLVRWIYEMWQTRRFFIDGRIFALALGGFTGMAIYLAIHILPNVEQGLHFARNNGPSGIVDQQRAAEESIQRQLEIWINTSPFELVFLALGIGLALYRREHQDRLLLTLLLVSEVLLLATYGYYREFYQVHFLPVFSLLMGRFVANILELRETRIPAGRLSGLAIAAMIFIVALATLTTEAQATVNDAYRDEFTAIARRLKADLPSNVVIVGNENYFLEMRSLNYYGIQTVTTDHWFLVKYQGLELWNVTKPEIFIISGNMDTPRYTDLESIQEYMDQNDFTLVHCYRQSGLITARVYYRHVPPDFTEASACTTKPVKETEVSRFDPFRH